MEALRAYGWDEAWASEFAALDLPGAVPARVASQHRDRWSILGEGGPAAARLTGSGQVVPRPVTGDWIVGLPGPWASDPWTILAVLPRRSAVRRGSAGVSHSEQVLAANVDRLWIVQGLDRPLNLRSLERYLALAWESGASPEIVLTKSDVAGDAVEAAESVEAIAFGVPVWMVSVENEAALATLRRSLVFGQTVALLGPSGAGKSTLINTLAGSAVTATGQVRDGDRKGRHTTTGRELFPIHGGALLVDTPGMRELKVLGGDEALGHTFPEIEDLSVNCRFRDCSHSTEPGCAVVAAVEQGRLESDRLASYRKLQAEADYELRKTDPRARAEHVAERKTAMRTLRYHPKYQGEDG